MMTTPINPPEWALEEARDLIHRVLEIGGGWETSEQLVALALDAAQRRGIEEARGEIGRRLWAVFERHIWPIIKELRALTSKEPT